MSEECGHISIKEEAELLIRIEKLEAERDALRARVKKLEKALKQIMGNEVCKEGTPSNKCNCILAHAALDEDGGK